MIRLAMIGVAAAALSGCASSTQTAETDGLSPWQCKSHQGWCESVCREDNDPGVDIRACYAACETDSRTVCAG